MCAAALCGGLLLAAGRVDRQPPAPPADAENYAEQLTYAVGTIQDQYVRPVSRAELIEVALAGLYEKVRVPMPSAVREGVKKAVAEQDLAGLIDLAPAGLRLGELYGAAVPNEVTALVVRVRKELGDCEALRGDNAILASLEAMVARLDPHSAVLRGGETQPGNGDESQPGAGLELAEDGESGPVLVKHVVPGGPAQRAGLRPGDEITHVDGMAVDGTQAAAARIRLREGTRDQPEPRPVRLTVCRAGRKLPRNLTVQVETFQAEAVFGVVRQADNTWQYFLDPHNKIAHVRLGALSTGISRQLQEVLAGLQAKGLRGLILDLRWCPGGVLEEAVDVADLFLRDCKIATVVSRGGQQKEFLSHRDGNFLGFPVVVLVNGDTSGGGELVAAALQDHRRAVVVGQRTVGKATIQKPFAVPVRDTALKLTLGIFVRPSGKNLHRYPDSKRTEDWGVRPDPEGEFRVSPELSRNLREWWLLQTLRPAEDNEALPLDDPGQDPQQQRALKILLRLLEQKAAHQGAADGPKAEEDRADLNGGKLSVRVENRK